MAIYDTNPTAHLMALMEKYADSDKEAYHFVISAKEVEDGQLTSLCQRIKKKVFEGDSEDTVVIFENTSERIKAV